MDKVKEINIAILGIGTVGYSTYENIIKNKNIILNKTAINLNVKTILEKDPSLHIGRVDKDCKITNNYDEILNDDSIEIIVELMGGVGFALDCVLKALEKGKHVVTANKALIAENICKINEACLKSKASIFYEAAVAGGIPIIDAIKRSFASNKIYKINSIVNGTCNYILSEMSQKGIDFPIVLKDAQEKGYAEADPTFDIKGIDAAHKIAILTGLAFGKLVEFKKLTKIEGITDVSIHDIKMAEELGYSIKLIASTEMINDKPDIRVAPTLVNNHHPLASVEGVYNAVFVEGDPVGRTMFYGRGAGGNPTSSAVISDIINCANFAVIGSIKHYLFYKEMQENVELANTGNPSKFYIRILAKDKPGVLAHVAGTLGKYNISIASVTQKMTAKTDYVPVFITTHEALEDNIIKAKNEITLNKEDAYIKESPFIMKILE